MKSLSREQFKFSWEETKHFHLAGTEMFGKEFEARVTTKRFLEDYELLKYSFEVYNEDGELYFKSEEKYDEIEAAKLDAEEYLKSAVEDFRRKIST